MRRFIIPITATALLALSLPGCGNAEEAAAGAQAEEPAKSEAAVDLMDKPMDGSSKESFIRDLEALLAANPEGHAKLEATLNSLLFGFGIGGDLEVLYTSLDGMTPNEIIGGPGQ
jgi:hypothetical protein